MSEQRSGWPTGEMLIRSMNARGNILASPLDDPLYGIPFPPDAWERIARYQRGDAIASGDHEVKP